MTNGPSPLEHPLLIINGIQHGFFTRRGGTSNFPYESLNLGIGSKDDPDLVAENRRRVATHFNQPQEHLLSLYQIHSNIALAASEPYRNLADRPHADGLVTNKKGLIVSALSADCAPLLFCDPTEMIVAACHAGWKGALYGIIESTLSQMVTMGAKLQNIRCVVGPCIAQASYEVSDTYEAEFLANDAESASFFIEAQQVDKRYFDLPGYCLSRLERAGLKQIASTGHDTCADDLNFFSNRRAFKRGEPDYGRLISAIMIN